MNNFLKAVLRYFQRPPKRREYQPPPVVRGPHTHVESEAAPSRSSTPESTRQKAAIPPIGQKQLPPTATPRPLKRPLVFDLGGVVLKWKPEERVEKVFGKSSAYSIDDLTHLIFQAGHDGGDWMLYDKGQLTTGQLVSRLSMRTGFQESHFEHLIEEAAHHLIPLPEMLETMRVLRRHGHPLYFLSNMPEPFASFLLETQDFFAIFEDGIFSSHIQMVKPEQDIYLLAHERWGLLTPPVFIDDNQLNVSASATAGWHGILFVNQSTLLNDLLSLKILSPESHAA